MKDAKPVHRCELEGTLIEIPLLYDERSGTLLEDYSFLEDGPISSGSGHPVKLTLEDACPRGEDADGRACVDCGSCRHYRQAEHSLLGVCIVGEPRAGSL